MIKKQKKKWHIKHSSLNYDKINALTEDIGCSTALATLLVNRGFNEEESATKFINKSQEKLYNPFLLNDMEKATERIFQAIKSYENDG